MKKDNIGLWAALALSLGMTLVSGTSLIAGPDRPPGPPPRERTAGPDRGERPERPEPERGPGRRPPRLEGPSLQDMTAVLDLTPGQQAQIAAILENTTKQIDATLTPDQREMLKQFRERRGPARGGRPGDERFGEGRPGGRPPGPPPFEDPDHGRPVEAIARELGVTPEQFREAFKKVRPAGPGERPTQAQRQANRKALSEALGVSPERLDEVMDKYRPGGRGDNGPEAE